MPYRQGPLAIRSPVCAVWKSKLCLGNPYSINSWSFQKRSEEQALSLINASDGMYRGAANLYPPFTSYTVEIVFGTQLQNQPHVPRMRLFPVCDVTKYKELVNVQ